MLSTERAQSSVAMRARSCIPGDSGTVLAVKRGRTTWSKWMYKKMFFVFRKIVQTRREVVILYEANGNVRQILTDGRPLPATDLTPWWYGYSIGHWENDTLVAESTGFRDDVWLDVEGSPMTSAGKITERWRRPYFGLLQIDITIDDPKAYTKPFTVRVNQRLMPDTELMEFVCEERDAIHYVGAQGK